MLECISLLVTLFHSDYDFFYVCMDNLFYVDLILYTSCRIGIAIK